MLHTEGHLHACYTNTIAAAFFSGTSLEDERDRHRAELRDGETRLIPFVHSSATEGGIGYWRGLLDRFLVGCVPCLAYQLL